MPQLLVPVIQAIGAAIGVTVGLTTAGYIASAVVLLGSLALSQSQKRKAERQARAQFDAAQVDRLANIPATVASRELVLGRVRKGGHVFFRGSAGPFKQYLAVCLGVAAHEIDAYEQIYFNDQPIEINGSDEVTTAPYGQFRRHSGAEPLTGNVTALSFTPVLDGRPPVLIMVHSSGLMEGLDYALAGNVVTITGYDALASYTFQYEHNVFVTSAWVRKYLGAPGQAADAGLQSLFPGMWTPAHRADGIAYLVCIFEFNETAFPSGPPNVTARVRGAKCYHPASGLTIWTENPAIMMRHVLTHPQFGKRTTVSAAENARFIAAQNACNTAIDYGGGAVPMYRVATVVPFGAPAKDVFDDLAQAMGGQWAYASGEIFVRAGVYQAPVLALTDADLAVVQRSNDGSVSQNPITISTHRARNEKVNTVVARIWDEAANYVQTPIPPFKAAAYVTADGAELVQEVTMPAVFSSRQAFHIAGIMLRDSRDPLTVTLPFKLRAYPLELFDGVTLTLARYGWVAKEFQVLGRTFVPDGYLQLTLKETAAAILQWGGGFNPAGNADNTTLPRPWEISPPTLVSVTSSESDLVVQADGTIISAVRVVWLPIQTASITQGGSVEVQYTVLPGLSWRSVSVPGADTQAFIVGVPDNVYVMVRARTRNALAVSDWGPQITVQTIGKTAPPPDISNLSIAGSVLSWSMATRPKDLAGFVFRFHYGANFDWGSAAPLHTGVLTQSPYDLVTRPGGVVTIMGKAIDTTGNMSRKTANIVMSLGDPPIANIVEQWDFDALGWPYAAGEQSGWTIVSGDPQADALDSFHGTDDQSFYGADESESFYGPSAYGQMVYVSPAISVGLALAGSIMTLLSTTQGIDLHIDYRLAGPGPFYESEGQPLYGDDADPFYGPPGEWQPWPGQIVAAREVYQFRVTIGAGLTRGHLQGLVVTIDAPDIEEQIADLAVGSGGTTIPYTKPFSAIKTVNATLQANGSGAVTVEITKTLPLAPVIRAFNSAHTAVSGATADLVLKGY